MLIDLLRLGKELAVSCSKGEPLLIEKRVRSIKETCHAFCERYQKESLHFSEEFCGALDGFGELQQEAIRGIENELYRKDAAEASKLAEVRKQWLRFEDRITAVMDIVRKEFHRRNQAPANFLLKGVNEMPPPKIIVG